MDATNKPSGFRLRSPVGEAPQFGLGLDKYKANIKIDICAYWT